MIPKGFEDSRVRGFKRKESLSELHKNIGEVERMLKALIKLLKNKHLNP